jgi:hypothetical protein
MNIVKMVYSQNKLTKMKTLFFILLVLWWLPFNSAYALRCNHQLIRVSDRKAEVIYHCGEPDYIDVRYINEGTRLRDPNRTLELSRFKEIVVEEWTYNFGSNKLMRLLLFKNGVLKEIRTLGYGY